MTRNSLRRFLFAGTVLPSLMLAFAGISSAQTTPFNPSPVNFIAPAVYKNSGHTNQSGIASLAFGDFNGDGNTDIVAVDGSSCVSFFPGTATGSFGSPVSSCGFSSGNIYFVAAGDFNGDGILDIAVVATNPGTISLMMAQGNGDGTFTYQNTVTINNYGEQATALQTADLNGDKKPDLVVSSTGSQSPNFTSTYVFLSNGNFTFTQSAIRGVGGCPYAPALVIADFNNDTIPDLAVSNIGCGLHEVDVMIGNGDGTFKAPVGYPTDQSQALNFAAGDVNGDGNVDLVVVAGPGGTPLNTFLGNGDGTFQAPIDSPSVYNPDYLAVGDFNGDGKDDVIVSSDYENGGALNGVQLSNGDGTFAAPVQYAVLTAPTKIYVLDLNGDKRMDWVSISNGSEYFSVALGSGTGGFTAAIDSFSTPGDAGATDAIVAADFNHDGKLDYATVGWDYYYPGINITFGDGTGHFGVPVHYSAGNNPIALVAGDFNNDGFPDIAVLDQSDGIVSVLLNNGDGTLGAAASYPVGAGGGLIQTGDFNGDKKLDLIVTNSGDGTVSVLLGNGDGTFKSQVVSNSQAGANYLAVADFNGDGIPDVAVSYYSDPDIDILLGNGDGSFQTPIPISTLGIPIVCGLAAGDFNNDGHADLALCAQLINNGSNGDGGVAIFLNDGSGGFLPPVSYPTVPVGLTGNPVTYGTPRVGDLNNDGNLDIVIPNTNSYPSGVSVGPAILLGRGDGTFVLNPAKPAITGVNEQDLALGDFNNDGLLDIVVQNFDPSAAFDNQSSTITMLLGTSGTEVVLTGSPNPATQGEPVTFTASVVTSFIGLPIPTGTITFKFGSTSAPVALENDVATYTTSALTVGATIVSAAYSGDTNFIPATSIPLSENVSTGPLTIETSTLPDAVQNASYSTSISATGGVPSYTFSLAAGSSLPSGLTISTAGVISGTPTTPGTTSFTVQAKDSSPTPQTVTANLSITVSSNLQITMTSLPNGVVGNSYSASLAATGGIPSYTFSLASGSSLPSGLTISAAGLISGTPMAPGSSNFTVQVQDSAVPAQSTSASFSITVTNGLTITTTSLPNGVQGVAYSASISAAGGVPSYTFSLASGSSLPSGLTISTAGLITGTPTAPGTTSFTVQAKDSSATPQTATAVLSITVASSLQFTTTSLQNGVVGNAYSATVLASGGNLPENFSIASGSSLPSGLTLSPSGLISGTPSAAGTSNFTVQVKDSSPTPQIVTANLSITVTPALSISTASLPNGVEGSSYSASVTATGGVPSYTYSLASGSSLPGGLSISAAGLITGTPTAPGTTSFTVQAKDSSTTPQTTTAVLSITVASSLQITTTSLQNGVVGNAYSATVLASGGNLPETFSIASGSSLPSGLTLSPSGLISGTPLAAGTSNFTIQVKDSSPTPQIATASLSVTVTPALSISTTSLPNGVEGSSYSASVSATGGVPSYTYSLASGSSLPSGLSISAAGLITGTPSAPGTATFTVQARDSSPTPQTATAALSITVTGNLQITTTTLPNGVAKNAYNATVLASGGNLPETFSLVSGSSLPPGLALSTSGLISGTPTTPGTTSFSVQVKDSSPTPQTVTANLSITITPALSIGTASLPNAAQGAAYSASVSATGGVLPYMYSLASGSSLPSGLTISGAGVISGTPTAAGTTSFTVQAKDSSPAPQTATAVLSITVAANLQITTTTLQNGAVGSSYSASVSATGGVPSYTFSLASGSSLPGGLVISAAGVISGTPTAPGTTSFTVQAKDSSPTPQTATASLSITVTNGLTITTSTLPNGVEATPYSTSLSASGGVLPYSYSIVSGSLPSGMMMSSLGVISGTASGPGTSSFTVQVKDSSPAPQTATASLSIAIGSILEIATPSLSPAVVGDSYSATVTALGGNAPYTFSLANGSALPAGLSISAAGLITGKPTAAGTSTFTVQLRDSTNTPVTVTAKLSITVNSPLAITTSSLPPITSSIFGFGSYEQVVQAQGGLGPFAFSIIGGSLPPGVTLGGGAFAAPAGSEETTVGGNPNAIDSGTYTFTVQVSDSLGDIAAQQLSISVETPLKISTTSLPDGGVGSSYYANLTATGGLAPYTFSLGGSGSLPAGLSLSSSGAITGTPSNLGTSTFTVQVKDSSGNTATVSLSITVSTVQITTITLPNGVVGTPYNAIITAAGGKAPYTFSLAGGTVPTGLSLSAAGAITGTPTGPSNWTFTVQVKDSSGATSTAPLMITVTSNLPPVQITTTSLPNSNVGVSYNATVVATGGAPPYTFSAAGLPSGLSMSAGGVISGVQAPIIYGFYGPWSFTVSVHDSENPAQTATALLTITVPPPPPPLLITTTTLPGGGVGDPYSASIAATGGSPSYTFSITGSGSLPSGLTLSSSGAITGTPLTSGTSTFSVQVKDSLGRTTTAAFTITIVPLVPLRITTTTLPIGGVGSLYSASISATGGTSPYLFSITGAGSLPNGLTMNSDGTISGTPLSTGTSRFTVEVVDSLGRSATASLSITVVAAIPLQITTKTLVAGVESSLYSVSVTATGGKSPYTFSITGAGSLPGGLTIRSSGIISGTPNVPGSFNFTVLVQDSSTPAKTATANLSITITGPLTITTASLPDAVAGNTYNAAITAAGGTPPYTFSGSLPTGLSISAAGRITGVPTTTGSSDATVTVSDASGATASSVLPIMVDLKLDITTTTLPEGGQGLYYYNPISISGGSAPYTLSVTNGTLPPGLGIPDPHLGLIQGSPQTPGTWNFTLAVTDSSNPQQRATMRLSITIMAGPVISTTSLPLATIGSPYSSSINVTGGTPPYTFDFAITFLGTPDGTVEEPILPPGLQFLNDGTSGILSIGGTPTGPPGTDILSITVTDSKGLSSSKSLNLVVVQ